MCATRAVSLIVAILLTFGLSLRSSQDTYASDPNWVEIYDQLLQEYVDGEYVDYARWHKNKTDLEKLKSVVASIAAAPKPQEDDAGLAFYLNAYNAWILHEILAKYPTEGPLAGSPLFFHAPRRIEVAGRKVSFDKLEQKIIRKKFDEPRIHFALNCASESCPPLANRAFTAESLEAMLEKLTRDFINDPEGVKIAEDGQSLAVSKIFEWYKEDFDGKEGIVPFINKYHRKTYAEEWPVTFQDYDWSLNVSR